MKSKNKKNILNSIRLRIQNLSHITEDILYRLRELSCMVYYMEKDFEGDIVELYKKVDKDMEVFKK